VIASRWTNLMMGFALFWIMQLHLSWVVLVPYLLLAFYYQARRGLATFLRALGWFAVGASVTASLLLPTYLKFGFQKGTGGTTSAMILNKENLTAFWGILIRTLSFASFEVPRLLGPHTTERVAFLKQEPWLLPLAVFLFVVGTAQVVTLIVSWFLRDSTHDDWRAIKYLLLFNICILYLSFLFSIKPPQSNHLYVTLPIPMIYSFYCWNRFLKSKRWQVFAMVFITCGVIFHVGLALHNRTRISLYTERAVIESAIVNKDYRILGERRPNTLY
jgi:hypothetical protein